MDDQKHNKTDRNVRFSEDWFTKLYVIDFEGVGNTQNVSNFLF